MSSGLGLGALLGELSQRARRILRSFAVASALIGAACAAATLQPRQDYEITRTTKTAYHTIPSSPLQYAVKSGDNLWNISKSNLNAATDREIVADVKAVVQKNEAKLPYLTIDNRAASGDTADGIPGDYLRPGDTLEIAQLPTRTVEKQYASFSYKPIQRSDDSLIAAAGIAVTLAGIAAASSRGRPKLEPQLVDQLEKAIDLYYGRYDRGSKPEVNVAAVCLAAGISKSTFYRRLKKRGLSSRTAYYSIANNK